jgi:hypothetical protein
MAYAALMIATLPANGLGFDWSNAAIVAGPAVGGQVPVDRGLPRPSNPLGIYRPVLSDGLRGLVHPRRRRRVNDRGTVHGRSRRSAWAGVEEGFHKAT